MSDLFEFILVMTLTFSVILLVIYFAAGSGYFHTSDVRCNERGFDYGLFKYGDLVCYDFTNETRFEEVGFGRYEGGKS